MAERCLRISAHLVIQSRDLISRFPTLCCHSTVWALRPQRSRELPFAARRRTHSHGHEQTFVSMPEADSRSARLEPAGNSDRCASRSHGVEALRIVLVRT